MHKYGLVISRICSVIYLPRHSNTKARQDTQHAFLIHRSSNLNANILYIILSSSLDPRAVLKSLLINAFGTQMHVSQGRPKTKDFNIALRRNGLDYYYDMYQYKSGHLYHLNSIYWFHVFIAIESYSQWIVLGTCHYFLFLL